MNSMPGMFKFSSVTLAVLCFAPIHRSANSQSTKKTQGERTAQPIFDEVAAEVGLKFQHYNGMTGKLWLPEIMGSGAALFDYDNDGDLDVFLVQGGAIGAPAARGASRLFRNDLTVSADGRRTLRFTDVTEKAGVALRGYGMGAAVGDYDND